MGIVITIKNKKSWAGKWIHKLFQCPTFWKSNWNTLWRAKPFYRCPVCSKVMHCYWDGNDVTGKGIDLCNKCASC